MANQGAVDAKEERFSSRYVLHSETVTPPIPVGQKLKFAAMNPFGEDKPVNIVTLDADNKEGYDGIYTGGMTACITTTVIERDAQGTIIRLTMMHYDGGLSENRLRNIMNGLKPLPEGGYRELIFSGGNGSENKEAFKERLNYLSGMEEDLDQLKFKKPYKYTFVPNTHGSACVTFDGYAGPLYGNQDAILTRLPMSQSKPDFMTVEQKSLADEKREFERLKMDGRVDGSAVERMQDAIAAAGCNDEVRAKLYFYTRELIFKTRFNSDIDQKNRNVDPAAIRAMECYKKQINALPLFSNKELILNAALGIACGVAAVAGAPAVSVVGVFGVGYLAYRRRSRKNARAVLEDEAKDNTQNKAVIFNG